MRQLSHIASHPSQSQEASTSASSNGEWSLTQHARRRLAQLSIGKLLRPIETTSVSDGASDGELLGQIGPLGRLNAEDVRWDVMGAANSGRRYRI
jgi:hypothetical protein